MVLRNKRWNAKQIKGLKYYERHERDKRHEKDKRDERDKKDE
jgi:hypothetical protein